MIWHHISSEDAPVLVCGLELIFMEFGPLAQILLDNNTSVQSVQMQHLAKKWGFSSSISLCLPAIWQWDCGMDPQDDKWTAAHVESSINDADFWYNAAPLANSSSPSSILLQSGHKWPNPNVLVLTQPPLPQVTRFSVGDQVYVKPLDARCHTPWMEGHIAAIISDTAVEVNGVP